MGQVIRYKQLTNIPEIMRLRYTIYPIMIFKCPNMFAKQIESIFKLHSIKMNHWNYIMMTGYRSCGYKFLFRLCYCYKKFIVGWKIAATTITQYFWYTIYKYGVIHLRRGKIFYCCFCYRCYCYFFIWSGISQCYCYCFLSIRLFYILYSLCTCAFLINPINV